MWHHGYLGAQISHNVKAAPVAARYAYQEQNDGTNMVLTLSPAPVDGVLLIACGIAADYTYGPPSGGGWTTLVSNAVWYKVASGEGTTFTFTDTGSKGENGGPIVMAEITGVGASPVEDTDLATSTATTPAGTSLGPNRIAIACATSTSALSSMTNSWTIFVNRNFSSRSAAIGYKVIPSTGSTGTSNWNASCLNLATITVKP